MERRGLNLAARAGRGKFLQILGGLCATHADGTAVGVGCAFLYHFRRRSRRKW